MIDPVEELLQVEVHTNQSWPSAMYSRLAYRLASTATWTEAIAVAENPVSYSGLSGLSPPSHPAATTRKP
jgi:hypothetical protein